MKSTWELLNPQHFSHSMAGWSSWKRRLDFEVRTEIEKLAHGQSLSQIAAVLLDATEPGKIEAAAQFLTVGWPEDRRAE